MVAGAEVPHARAERLDDAGALVAGHRRAAGLRGAVDRVQVGVVQPARVQANENLAGSRLGELDLADLERHPRPLEDRRPDAHQAPV